jgi:hypothetical protein
LPSEFWRLVSTPDLLSHNQRRVTADKLARIQGSESSLMSGEKATALD